MKVIYCSNCGKKTGHKRALGWGTFFAALFTLGISLFFIPFYPKRCIICGTENIDVAGNPLAVDSLFQPKKWYKTWWGIALIIILFILGGKILSLLGLGK